MIDDDQDDILLDWRLVRAAASGDDKPIRTAGRGNRLRSPPVITQTPCAQLVAFPAGRRLGEIRRLAGQMCRVSYERGEAHLQLQLRMKADALRRRGFSDAQVRHQITGLEAAVRAELWRRELGPGGSRGGPQQ